MSAELPAEPFPPPARPVDLNRVPLGRIAAEHADRVGAIVGGSDSGDRPRRSQFGASI